MIVSGASPDGKLVEIMELVDHPYFVAVQYHPEFKSKPTAAHPLFADLVEAAIARQSKRVERSKDVERSVP
jgi:CTP synthase